MRHLRILLASLVALLAVGSVAAASASAEAPEYGKCVAKAGGKYATSGCTTESATTKKFEWVPTAPGPGPKFTSKLKEKTVVVLENVEGLKIVCKSALNKGEITGPQTTTIQFSFDGCEVNALPCTTPGQASGVITTGVLPDRLIIIKKEAEPAKSKIGDDIGAPGAPFANAVCGGTGGFQLLIVGSVIYPVKTNKMAATEVVKFSQIKGHQKPEHGEGEPPDVLESSAAGGPFRQTGLSLTETAEYEGKQKVEINSVV